jgi:hypothetical protein
MFTFGLSMSWAHSLLAYYNWAVINGLWRDVIAATVAGIIGYGLAHLLSWRPKQRLRRIERFLDTSEPGGLTDVVDAIDRNTDAKQDGP